MQLRNKALAGIAIVVALAGCASQDKKKTVSENDGLQQQRAQLAYEQQLAYKNNIACKNAQAAGLAGGQQQQPQASGTAPSKDTAQITAPSGSSGCNCSCLSNPEKAKAAEASS